MTDRTEYTLTTGDVAKQLGCSIDTVVLATRNGKLGYIQTPGGWRKFRPDDVDAYVATLSSTGGEAA